MIFLFFFYLLAKTSPSQARAGALSVVFKAIGLQGGHEITRTKVLMSDLSTFAVNMADTAYG